MKNWIVTISGCVVLAFAALACAQQPATPETATADPVVARIGDEVITSSELEATIGSSLLNLRQQIYQVKVTQLNQQIFDRLVLEAATAEGITKADYLNKHIDDNLGEPDEGEIVKVMTQYRARLAQDDAQARQQVVAFLNQQARQGQEAILRDRLFAEAGVKILLEPPRVEVALGEGSPTRGPLNAPVVLVEFTDFQCPYCTRVQPTLNQIFERYEGQIVHVFKNLPLPNHAQAPLAAEAALCAQDQGKFWPYHDWLFANQRSLSRESMLAQAGEMDIDSELFVACIDQKTYAEKVRADSREARSFGITGTPGFLINGRVISGAQPLETFEAIINEELERKGLPVPEKKATEATAEAPSAEATEPTS
jgi:protein-disulfide isomerase